MNHRRAHQAFPLWDFGVIGCNGSDPLPLTMHRGEFRNSFPDETEESAESNHKKRFAGGVLLCLAAVAAIVLYTLFIRIAVIP